ncbi:TPA: hypothetical protein ACRRXY_000080 [Morganella morganii]
MTDEQETYLLTPQEQAGRNIAHREQEKRSDADLKSIMSTEEGRRFMWRLLGESNVFGSSFSADPYLTAFKEGCRNFGLQMFEGLHRVCPELYALMADEAAKQQEKQS